MNTFIHKMNNAIQNNKMTELGLTILELLSKSPYKIFTIDGIKNDLWKVKRKSNYATVYRAVDSLVKQNILLKEKYGMASKIQLNYSDNTLSLLSLIETKKFEQFLGITHFRSSFSKLTGLSLTTLKEITADVRGINDFRCVLIFGSYAKGTPRPTSDLDLLVIYDVPDIIKNWGEKQQENYINEIKTAIMGTIKTSQLRGGPIINPIIISSEEHREMLQNKEENVAKETLLNHLIIKGYYEYWSDVLNVK